jgi:phosphoheptose isomerase
MTLQTLDISPAGRVVGDLASKAEVYAIFAAEAGWIAEACWAMAQRFSQGGRLLAFANGACATDAQHVAVEFVHPVIVGKRPADPSADQRQP